MAYCLELVNTIEKFLYKKADYTGKNMNATDLKS